MQQKLLWLLHHLHLLLILQSSVLDQRSVLLDRSMDREVLSAIAMQCLRQTCFRLKSESVCGYIQRYTLVALAFGYVLRVPINTFELSLLQVKI